MNKICYNQEQLEAHQVQLNKENEERFQKLPLEDQEKIKALDRAIRILTEAQIPCYLFPFLKSREDYPKTCSQYNNAREIKDFWNESGNLNRDLFKDFVCSAISGMFKIATESCPEIAKLPIEQHFQAFIPYLAYCLNTDFNRIKEYQENA
jgi:hypothetical protein